MEHRLGRLHAPDERDHLYLIRSVLPKPRSLLPWRYWWDDGWWGDQGNTSECVAFAWEHWLDDGPVLHAQRPLYNPHTIYDLAQQHDEWPGENYEGTSVRGGAKAVTLLGSISEYRWAFTLNDITQTILQLGPVVVGTNWYNNMFTPNLCGFISPGGGIAGGHAYVLNGVNIVLRKFRMKNSWGRAWGRKGHAWINFSDMDRLLSEDGEACLAMEIV